MLFLSCLFIVCGDTYVFCSGWLDSHGSHDDTRWFLDGFSAGLGEGCEGNVVFECDESVRWRLKKQYQCALRLTVDRASDAREIFLLISLNI